MTYETIISKADPRRVRIVAEMSIGEASFIADCLEADAAEVAKTIQAQLKLAVMLAKIRQKELKKHDLQNDQAQG